MKRTKTASILYRAVSGIPVARQQEACRALVKELGLKISAEYNADTEPDALKEWRRGLKSTDVAIVAALTCIPEWRAKGAKPGPVLGEVLLDFATRKPPMLLISAMDGVSSAEGAKWLALARTAHDALSLGARKRPRKEYQRMAKLSHAARGASAEARFAALPKSVQDACGATWRDPRFSNADDARAALPEDVKRDIITSVSVAYRVLKERRPGDKRAGGRGRKVARKQPKSKK